MFGTPTVRNAGAFLDTLAAGATTPTTPTFRKLQRKLPHFGTPTARNAGAFLDALAAGATTPTTPALRELQRKLPHFGTSR